MPERNVEIVRKFNAIWDPDLLRAVVTGTASENEIAQVRDSWRIQREMLDPDVELRMQPFIGSSVRKGIDQWVAFWQDWVESWEKWSFAWTEWEARGEHVLVRDHLKARGRGGLEVDADQWEVWTLRDGRIAGFRVYLTRDEALDWIESSTTADTSPEP